MCDKIKPIGTREAADMFLQLVPVLLLHPIQLVRKFYFPLVCVLLSDEMRQLSIYIGTMTHHVLVRPLMDEPQEGNVKSHPLDITVTDSKEIVLLQKALSY